MMRPTSQADREVVCAAIGHDGFALGFAAQALRGDRDIVREARRDLSRCFRHDSSALRFDSFEILGPKRVKLIAKRYK